MRSKRCSPPSAAAVSERLAEHDRLAADRAERSVWWLNDRTYPYRASLTIPNASAIDSALAANQGIGELWKTAMRQVVFPA